MFKHWKGLIGPLLKGRSFLEQKESTISKILAQRQKYDAMRNAEFSQTIIHAVQDARRESCKVFVVAGAAHLFWRGKGFSNAQYEIANVPLRTAREKDLRYDVIGLPPKA